MAASDAKAIPVKNAAYRVTFPILDADGDLVTGAASLDSEVSVDGAGFIDCTNEATEIATASGLYYLDLTASEMNGDTVALIVKTGTAGAKTTPIVLYTAARTINDLAYPTTTGRSIDVTATGEVGIDWANIGGPTTSQTLSGTTVGTVTSLAAGAVTAAAIATGAVDADALAADAVAELADGVWDEARAGHVAAGSFGEGVATVVGGVTVDTNNDKTGYRLSATGVDDVLEEVVEGTSTLRQYLRLMASALFAKLSGAATTTITIRDVGDTKNRIVATVDANGNRSAFSTLDGT